MISRNQLIIYWSGLVLLGVVCERGDTKKKVAIIGGGIGGTSTCYFLQKLVGDKVDIDVYEPKEIGGRLATTQIGDLHYETGGSIIHEDNLYVQQFMEEFNLTKKKDKETNVPGRFGIYDGTQYLFKEARSDWMTLLKLAYRYGPANFYWFQKSVDAMLKDFSHIYTLQKEKRSFLTVESLLRAMSDRFVPQLKSCAKNGMKSVTSQLLLDELIAAGNLVNYGQSVYVMPEFVTYVSCAGMSGKLFAIHGGNKQLATNLLTACSASLLRRKVAKIVHRPETGTYVVHSVTNSGEKTQETDEAWNEVEHSRKSNSEKFDSNENSDKNFAENPTNESDWMSKEYDYVVVATPISLSDIDFGNMDDVNGVIDEQRNVQYHTTVTTLVRGWVNTSLTEENSINEILLTSPNGSFFNSLSLLSSTSGDNSARVYKIFSQKALTESNLNQLFPGGKYRVKYEQHWRAYPEYTCKEGFFESDSFRREYLESGRKDGTVKDERKDPKESAKEMEVLLTRKTIEMEDYLKRKVSDFEDHLRVRAKERKEFVREKIHGGKSQDVLENLLRWEDSEQGWAREWETFVRGNLRDWEVYVKRNVREWEDFVTKYITKKDEIFEDNQTNKARKDGIEKNCEEVDIDNCEKYQKSSTESHDLNCENIFKDGWKNPEAHEKNKHAESESGDGTHSRSIENSFVLNKGLYYVNVIELAASAMEMSIIGAHNVVLLINDLMKEKEMN